MLELLLAVTIMAMLALSLYTSMRVGLRARRTATEAVQPVRASTVAMDMICRDLESVMPPTGTLAGPFLGMRQLGSAGNADYLEFCCLGSEGDEPRHPLYEGIRHVVLTLRSDVTPPVLVREVTRNLLARAQTEPEEEILCRNVRSLTFQYFDGTTWLEEWDSTALGDVLPFAVQIVLEMQDGERSILEQTPSRVVRIVPLACAKLSTTSGSDESSSATNNTGTTGGTAGTGGAGGTGSRSGATGGGR